MPSKTGIVVGLFVVFAATVAAAEDPPQTLETVPAGEFDQLNAAILRDADDPTYYVDPNSPGASANLAGTVTAAAFKGSGAQLTNVPTTIADGSITSAKIADGTITNNDVNASAAIAGAKISPNFGTQTIVTTGSVGIGTTGPAARLDVQGAATADALKLRNGLDGTTNPLTALNDNGIQTHYWAHNAAGDGHFVMRKNDNSNAVVLDTNGVSYLTGGRVGIGRTNPVTALDVNGAITATGGNSAEWSAAYAERLRWNGGADSLNAATGRSSLGLGTLATKNTVTSAEITDGAVTAAKLQDLTPSPAGTYGSASTIPRLTVDADGRITAATTVPLTNVNLGVTGNGTPNFLARWTGATTLGNALVYDNGSNVGIGTSNPSAKLEVTGRAKITDGLQVDKGITVGKETVISDVGCDAGDPLSQYNCDTAPTRITTGRSQGLVVDIDADGSQSGDERFEVRRQSDSATLFRVKSQGGNAWLRGTLTQASDRALKTSILPLPLDALQRLRQLQAVTYTLKADAERLGQNRAPPQIGFVAQDVEPWFPELVQTGPDGTKGLIYDRFIPILVEVIKAQQVQLEALQAQVDALQAALQQPE